MNVRKNLNMQEKNLNLTTKIALLYRNAEISTKFKAKNLNFESGHLNFTKFQEKNLNNSDKIRMNGRSVYACTIYMQITVRNRCSINFFPNSACPLNYGNIDIELTLKIEK